MISKEVLDKLEFTKVLEYISKYTYSEPGKKNIFEQRPLSNTEEVEKEGRLVTLAKEILIESDFPPINHLSDVSESLSKSNVEGTLLNTKEILEILNLAETSRRIYGFLKNQSEDFREIKDISQNLFIDKVFEHTIRKVFTESGEISDHASPELKNIRNEVRAKGDQLRKSVNRILKQLSEDYLVQEEYLTQRDGRIVVPVKAEHKRHVKGFIHSESASGQTVYIEPEATLELNNDILSLKFAERREIENILRKLTERIGDVSYELKNTLWTIGKIDSIFAKARYSMEIIGSFPSLNEEKPFHLIDGRHPILLKRLGRDTTVEMSLRIENENVIVITGPNAGGKTVVLKTVGLLTLMVLSGIHIPAHPDTNFHHFNHLLVDIGDLQSIEDDLSTFSSHLSNILRIIEEANRKSLVLLDEIGTGTDPTEGSALAMAVLIELRDRGAKVLATTHHGNLKMFANELENFQNASMEFDLENLAPTYRFQQGTPGSSYAFEVASRIGMSNELIDRAKEYVDTDKTKVEEFLIQLEERSRKLREKLRNMEVENTRLKGLANLYENKVSDLEKQKKNILKEAQEKADSYLKDINKQLEHAIKRIRETQADKEVVKEERRKINEIKSENKKIAPKEKTEQLSPKNHKLKSGDYVKIKNTGTEGTLIEVNEAKNRGIMNVGSMKMTVKLSDLVPEKKKEKRESRKYSQYYTPSVESTSLDIRGKKPEEVEYEVIRFIDDAYSSNLKNLEIIHGKGTGVLKNTVHQILKKHNHVKDYNFGKIEQGGEGVTLVELA
jgi:DNA mismatch repair protein MutS2